MEILAQTIYSMIVDLQFLISVGLLIFFATRLYKRKEYIPSAYEEMADRLAGEVMKEIEKRALVGEEREACAKTAQGYTLGSTGLSIAAAIRRRADKKETD